MRQLERFGLRQRREGLLHRTIFQRVETDDRRSAARCQSRRGLLKQPVQRRKLAVDRDPKGLERPRRRVDLLLPSATRRIHAAHQVGQLPRCGDRLHAAGCCNLSRDRPAQPLLAEPEDDIRQLTLAQRRQQVRGRRPGRSIQPHVQRRVLTERHATRRVVHLVGREPQVGQHRIRGRQPRRVHRLAQAREVPVVQRQPHLRPLRDRVQPVLRPRQVLRVRVDPQVRAARPQPRDQQRRVPASAQRAVHAGSAGARGEDRQHLLGQHGDVAGVSHGRQDTRTFRGSPARRQRKDPNDPGDRSKGLGG